MLIIKPSFLSVGRDNHESLDTISIAGGPVLYTSRSDRRGYFKAVKTSPTPSSNDTFVSRNASDSTPNIGVSCGSKPIQQRDIAQVDWSRLHSIPKVDLPTDYDVWLEEPKPPSTSHVYHFYPLLDMILDFSMDVGVKKSLALVLRRPPVKSLQIILACHASYYVESICKLPYLPAYKDLELLIGVSIVMMYFSVHHCGLQ